MKKERRNEGNLWFCMYNLSKSHYRLPVCFLSLAYPTTSRAMSDSRAMSEAKILKSPSKPLIPHPHPCYLSHPLFILEPQVKELPYEHPNPLPLPEAYDLSTLILRNPTNGTFEPLFLSSVLYIKRSDWFMDGSAFFEHTRLTNADWLIKKNGGKKWLSV